MIQHVRNEDVRAMHITVDFHQALVRDEGAIGQQSTNPRIKSRREQTPQRATSAGDQPHARLLDIIARQYIVNTSHDIAHAHAEQGVIHEPAHVLHGRIDVEQMAKLIRRARAASMVRRGFTDASHIDGNDHVAVLSQALEQAELHPIVLYGSAIGKDRGCIRVSRAVRYECPHRNVDAVLGKKLLLLDAVPLPGRCHTMTHGERIIRVGLVVNQAADLFRQLRTIRFEIRQIGRQLLGRRQFRLLIENQREDRVPAP